MASLSRAQALEHDTTCSILLGIGDRSIGSMVGEIVRDFHYLVGQHCLTSKKYHGSNRIARLPSMPYVTIQSRQMFVEDQGSGPPLLLVHGFPLDHTMWRYQISALSASYRVIVPDLPGFGQSHWCESKSMSMANFANDLVALLEQLSISQPVVFCGLSMGGYIAWPFFQLHRDHVAALILCDTRALADTPKIARARLFMATHIVEQGMEVLLDTMLPKLFSEKTRQEQPQLFEEILLIARQNSRNGVAAAQRGMSERPDVTERLPSIDVPTLFICGEHDVISPPSEMIEMAERIPRSLYVEIPDAGHLAPLENPVVVNQAILRFLALEF